MKNNKETCSISYLYVMIILCLVVGGTCGYLVGCHIGEDKGYINGFYDCGNIWIDALIDSDLSDLIKYKDKSFSIWSRNGALINTTDPNIMELNRLIKYNNKSEWTYYMYTIDDKYYINSGEVFLERPKSLSSFSFTHTNSDNTTDYYLLFDNQIYKNGEIYVPIYSHINPTSDAIDEQVLDMYLVIRLRWLNDE